jgi:hypothetical protein
MKKIKSGILILFLLLSTSALYSQSHPTLYELKVRSIVKKFLMDIGFNNATAEKASIDNNYQASIKSQIDDKVHMYQMMNGDLKALSLSTQLMDDLEAAKKLMNPQEKEQERIKTLKAEKQAQEKQEKEEYLKSDAYHLKTIIHNRYVKWSTKGEFEKTTDYEARMADKQKAVRDIIISSVQDYVKEINANATLEDDWTQFSCYIGDYNADNELLQLIFINGKGLEVNGQMKMSPDRAQRVKSETQSTTINEKTFYYSESFRAIQDRCNIGFYKNSIMSSKLSLKILISRNGNVKHYEHPEITILNPIKLDLGEQFFTASNLDIDMKGNENFNFNDINNACKQLEDNENKATQTQNDIKQKKIDLENKFDNLVLAGNNSKAIHENPNKTLQYYKQAANIYDEKTIAELYDNSTAPDPSGKQYIQNKLKNLNNTIKALSSQKAASNPYENIFNRIKGSR